MARETILVIDDDPACREECTATLSAAGFEVCQASGAAAAVALIEDDSLRRRLALATVDYLMPGGNGFVAFGRVQALCPDVAGVLLTGHTSLHIAAEALNRGFSQVVSKPVERQALLEAVAAALAERRNVLENTRLRALARLYDALCKLSAVDDLTALHECIVTLATEETSADAASLMLLDEREQVLKIAAAVGLEERVVRQARRALGEPVSGWVLRHGVTVEIAPDKPVPSRLRAHLTRPDLGASLCLPLCPTGRPLGVLNLSRLGSAHAFGPGDLEVATVLANDAALNMFRLRMLGERRRQEQMATLGRLAANIIHDLRNPVTVIGGAAELLIELANGPTGALERVKQHASDLDRMCRQLLSFSRGTVGAPVDRFDVSSLYEELLTDLADPCTQLGIEVVGELHGDCVVEAPYSELLATLVDLVTEGAAVSRDRCIRLSIEGNARGARVSIEGSADGAAEWLTVDDPARALAISGPSLSLALARTVAERHGGSLAVDLSAERYRLVMALPSVAARETMGEASQPRNMEVAGTGIE